MGRNVIVSEKMHFFRKKIQLRIICENSGIESKTKRKDSGFEMSKANVWITRWGQQFIKTPEPKFNSLVQGNKSGVKKSPYLPVPSGRKLFADKEVGERCEERRHRGRVGGRPRPATQDGGGEREREGARALGGAAVQCGGDGGG